MLRIAWFSPLPPFPSGIGDYSFELLPLISERADVEVFCPDRTKTARGPLAPPGIRRYPPHAYADRADRYDAVFHHLGNNPDHDFVLDAALADPRISVFHDLVQHHLLADRVHEPPRFRRLVRLMEAEYGETGLRFVELARRGVNTEFEKFLFPLNATVARASRAIVVHSRTARDRILEAAPESPVSVIPHHAGRPPPDVAAVDRAEARRRLALPPHAFLVGHMGFVTRPKQPGPTLAAYAHLVERVPDSLFLVVGMNQAGPGLARLIARYGLEGNVRLVGYVGLPTLYLYLKAVDAVINLRYPSAGESSGTVARGLAEGRATIVSNIAAFADLPSDVVLRVELDEDQAAGAGQHLVRLAEDRAFRTALEERSRRYAETVLDPARCADLYVRVAGASN